MGSHSPETWFETLSTHPVFTSPPSSSSKPQVAPSASSSTTGRKNTFGISALDSPAGKSADDAENDEEDVETEMIYDKHGDEVQQRKHRMVIRGGKEVVVVVGGEIRLVDLSEVKEGKEARYWILRNPDIDFTIYQISLNPTNKLLTLVGSKQIGVIMLPSIGSLARGEQGGKVVDGKSVRCKGTKIAPEIYSKKAESRIVKAKWHPWGEHGTSLLVLTDDTILREFDTSHSSTQPLQAIPLHPSVPSPQIASALHTPSTASSSTLPSQLQPKATLQKTKRSTFTAEDIASKTAVSFDLGKGDGEWGALAVWGCMKNGDVWTVCPFLPEFAVVPEVYIETLNLYLGSKAQQYRIQNPASSSSSAQADLGSSRQSVGFSPSEHDLLGKKLAAQQKWARSLSRQVEAHKASSDGFSSGRGGCDYPVRPPRDGRTLKRQGPYLVQPEPRELPLSEEAGWGIEGTASDIVVIADKESTGKVAGTRVGMNVVGLAWVDGRVDLCVEAQKVEAEWEVDDNQDWAEDPLLTLVTFDSIDLQLLETLESAEESFTPLVCNPVTFDTDPMDSTSLFVHHLLGAHWIGFKPWKTALSHIVQLQDADEEERELGELWKQRSTSQTAWVVDTWSGQEDDSLVVPLVGSAVLADIELGYAFLAIASDKTAAAIQLNEFDDVEESEPDDLSTSRLGLDKSRAMKDTSTEQSSYLGGQPYDIDEAPFDSILQKLRSNIRLGSSSGKRIDSVSEEDLKMLGSVMQGYGEAVLDLKRLSGRVEGRADLQVKEVALQLQRIKDAMRKVADLHGDSSDDDDEGLLGQGTGGSVDEMKQRYERILRTQQDLGRRLAHVQGKLINNLQPDLSDTEKAWRAETERVAEMMKETGADSELTTQYQGIRKQFDAMKPKLQQAQRDSDQRREEKANDAPKAASSDLEQEAKHIAVVLEKLKKIRVKVEDLEGVY